MFYNPGQHTTQELKIVSQIKIWSIYFFEARHQRFDSRQAPTTPFSYSKQDYRQSKVFGNLALWFFPPANRFFTHLDFWAFNFSTDEDDDIPGLSLPHVQAKSGRIRKGQTDCQVSTTRRILHQHQCAVQRRQDYIYYNIGNKRHRRNNPTVSALFWWNGSLL